MPTNTATAWSALGTVKAGAARSGLGRDATPTAASDATPPYGRSGSDESAESAVAAARRPLTARPRRLDATGAFCILSANLKQK